MSAYIPLEIQKEILKRLLLKPLLQIRTVSKSFKSLIDSPNFIKSYYLHHPQTDDRFIVRYSSVWLSRDPPEDRRESITFIVDDNDNDSDDDDFDFDFDDDGDDIYDYGSDSDDDFIQLESVPSVPNLIKTTLEPNPRRVVGSSHGLLCFRGCYKHPNKKIRRNDCKEMVVLWNPSIRKSVGIQMPYVSDSSNENFYDFTVDNVIGFGVCPVTFDPTVINIQCIDYKRERNGIRCFDPWKVGVFTLSTGTWSNLSTGLPRESIRLEKSQVVIDRFIYWVALDMLVDYNCRYQSKFLIKFDLTAKEFKEINLTDRLTKSCRIMTIANLKESLVLLEDHAEDRDAYCLWMMKEQGVSRSFTKLYTIKLPEEASVTIKHILGFKKTGEVIMETQDSYDRFREAQMYEWSYDCANDLGIIKLPYVTINDTLRFRKAVEVMMKTRDFDRLDEDQIYKWNIDYADGLKGQEDSFFICPYMETLLLLDKSDGYIYLPIAHG